MNELNQQIAMVVAVGQEPNDLRDQRDLLIDEIAGYTDVAVTETGRQRQGLGRDRLAADRGPARPTRSTPSPSAAAGAATVNGVATTITSGSLRGLVDLRDSVIGGTSGYLAQLDTLAAAVATLGQHPPRGRLRLDGSTGNAFFAGTTAATLAISAPVAASVNAIAASDTAAGVPGGVDNAIALAQLQYVVQTIGATTTTLDGFYAQMVAKLGRRHRPGDAPHPGPARASWTPPRAPRAA